MKLKTKVEVCGWLVLAGIVIYGLKYFISILGSFTIFRNALAMVVMLMLIIAISSDNEIADKVRSVG
ncbi:hypothetical protein LCGC14_0548220 [marine sediment metagenome]|uniref:Uncharacterized protein n=1 Tax=marine sediment metagenome TaxID=412755 RepID=A0A0F9UC59_9ZZZZ